MEQVEKKDIQGIIVRGYAELPAACFLLVKITDNIKAKLWLKENILNITTGDQKPMVNAMNIAFTFNGLKTLGLEKNSADTFPMEFEDGMTSRHRQEMLGDYGTSDPENWLWGGKKNDNVDLLLLLYAKDVAELNNQFEKINPQLAAGGLSLIRKLETTNLTERKEHFGFHDGISQPTIRGLGRDDIPENTVSAGEFILGYKNEYNQFADCPLANSALDKDNHLPSYENTGMKNLGKNGTYLVFRQLEQNVEAFWKYMDSKTADADGTCNPEKMIWLASKAVGRWPSGAPLILSPDKDDKSLGDSNDFLFKETDLEGMKCPFGAHIRRSNPRDVIDRGSERSISIANKHRILRRGRVYGNPVAATMNPEDILKEKNISGERGLYFICLNTDFNRQFEFVQNFWINNPKFDGLYDERDPVTGNHSNTYENKRTGTFSVPGNSIRNRYNDVKEFVTVKGGGYFFLPGIQALHFFATM